MDVSYTSQECRMDESSDRIKELNTKHFQIQASNWGALSQQSKQYPIFIYGFATDPQLSSTGDDISRFVQQIDQPEAFARMMIFSSHNAAGRHLSNRQTNTLFKNKGIEWIGYNQEGDKTPASTLWFKSCGGKVANAAKVAPPSSEELQHKQIRLHFGQTKEMPAKLTEFYNQIAFFFIN